MAHLALSFENGDESLSVRRFSVLDSLSGLFEVSVLARSPRDDLDLESFVGLPAGFLAARRPDVPRAWSGIVSEMELLQVEPPGPQGPGLSTYSLRIVPALWLLTQKRDNRIFQAKSYPEILKTVLGEHNLEPRISLAETHPKHDYVVQYGETDFAFLSRLCEEEGITFYFEQTAGDAGLKSVLVLADKPASAAARSALHYVDTPNQAGGDDFATDVHVSQRVRPGRFTIRDYDFLKPDYRLVGEADKKPPEDPYEHYRYEHGAFLEEKPGKLRADIALGGERRDRRKIAFRTNVYDVAPAQVFSFDNHPRSDLGPGERLLVVSTSFEGTANGEWQMTAEAVYAKEPYRPALVTPKPKISGLQSAIVVGPKGEEIHTDEHGRVKVQFHWDRDGQYDDKSSCWLRVSHGWAGAAFGMFALPRVGQEVLVGFWEGDPDRPLVVGRVYNAKTRPPYKLPDEKTRSTWKSNSTPKSDGFNEIMFEDKAGKELVYIQAQRDLSKLVKRNEAERTGANRSIVVGANRSSAIGANDSTLVGAKYSLAIVQPKPIDINGDGEPDIVPQQTLVEMVDGKITLTTGKATIELDGPTITLKADGDIRIKAGGEVNIQGGPFVKINC
jgi:type VI secretion system secreted protein VgrG